jgi:hypothetical protein
MPVSVIYPAERNVFVKAVIIMMSSRASPIPSLLFPEKSRPWATNVSNLGDTYLWRKLEADLLDQLTARFIC